MNNLETSPLVSVIIPAYNAAGLIERTLRSVLSQTYSNLEVLVIDDGSTDRTAEVVRTIAESDRRVRLLQQPNAGVAAARNLGIQEARGEFIAPIDADDIWYPQTIEKQVRCLLQAGPSVGIVYAWSFDIDQADLPTGNFHASTIEGSVYLTLLCHYFLGNGSCSLIRRACLEQVNGYSSQLKNSCEDWDLYLRISERYEFRVVPEFLVGYRKTPNSLSQNLTSMATSHALMLKSVRRKYLSIPSFLYQLSSSSFYIYLAQQSSRKGDPKNAIELLDKAFKICFLISFFRVSTHIILLRSIFQLIRFQITGVNYQAHGFRQHFLESRGGFSLDCEDSLFPKFNPNPINRNLKNWIENALHQLIKVYARDRDRSVLNPPKLPEFIFKSKSI